MRGQTPVLQASRTVCGVTRNNRREVLARAVLTDICMSALSTNQGNKLCCIQAFNNHEWSRIIRCLLKYASEYDLQMQNYVNLSCAKLDFKFPNIPVRSYKHFLNVSGMKKVPKNVAVSKSSSIVFALVPKT